MFQILSWVIFSFLMFTFFLVFVPLLEENENRIIAALGYGILLTAVIVGWIVSSSTDPVDKTIWSLLQATPREYPSGELLYCCFCKCKVHKRSKHCRVCNKCVGDFDHHCKWLNNCVGGANYKVFFFLINAAAALTAFHSGWGVKIVIDAWKDEDFPSSARASALFSGMHRNSLLSLLFISTILSGCVCVLLVHLLMFHIYLISKKLSTYDYILLQRAKAVEKQEKKEKRNRVGAELKETAVPVGEIERSRQVSVVSGTTEASGMTGMTGESEEETHWSPDDKRAAQAHNTSPASVPSSSNARPRAEEPAQIPLAQPSRAAVEKTVGGPSEEAGRRESVGSKKAIRLKPLPPSAAAHAEREVKESALLPGVVASTEGETPKD